MPDDTGMHPHHMWIGRASRRRLAERQVPPELLHRRWRGKAGDRMLRLTGLVVAAWGALTLFLLWLHLQRSRYDLLAFVLGFVGCFVIAAGNALASTGNRFLSTADRMRGARRLDR